MSIELILATTAISLALVFYTAGVFSERHAGKLKLPHLAMFWIGLAFDTTGTTIMTMMAQSSGLETGLGVHGVTGALAIVLMLIHAGWATVTYVRHNAKGEANFHKFSTLVWLLWLVPYITGLLIGIPMIHLLPVCAIGTSIIVVGALAFLMLRKRGDGKGKQSHSHA